MANRRNQTVLIYKGKGAGNAFDLGGLSVLYSIADENSKSNPAMSQTIKDFRKPTAQIIASAKEKAKSLIADFKDDTLPIAKGLKMHGEIGNRSFELVY